MMNKPSEDLSSLSGTDARKLLEIIHASLSCGSGEDFFALFPKMRELLPFDFALATMGCFDDSNDVILEPCVNMSFPEELLQEYRIRNYSRVDDVMRENFISYKPQYWEETRKRIKVRQDVTSLFREFDMADGYSHGVRSFSSGQSGSMFCFSAPAMEYHQRYMVILDLLIPHLHMAFTQICGNRNENSNTVILTAREKEVLNWMKQGKSSWDMSVILDISARTVNYHVYNIMQKLEAVNRAQTVAAAVRLGLIEFD